MKLFLVVYESTVVPEMAHGGLLVLAPNETELRAYPVKYFGSKVYPRFHKSLIVTSVVDVTDTCAVIASPDGSDKHYKVVISVTEV